MSRCVSQIKFGREVKVKAQSAELIGLSSEAGVPTMERVAVPAHTRPKYQLASWCKRWTRLALAGPVQSGPRSRWGPSR